MAIRDGVRGRQHTSTPTGRGAIADGWDIGGNANGGYLLALATSHMRAVSGRPDPISVTAHYLAPGSPGPVQVDATVVKAGKRFTTCARTMHRDGKPMLQVLGSFGDVTANAGGFVHDSLVPVAMPPIEECVRRAPSQSGVEVPMMDRLDVRLRPADVGFASGHRVGQAEVAGWFAFADGQPLDTLALLLVCDASAAVGVQPRWHAARLGADAGVHRPRPRSSGARSGAVRVPHQPDQRRLPRRGRRGARQHRQGGGDVPPAGPGGARLAGPSE